MGFIWVSTALLLLMGCKEDPAQALMESRWVYAHWEPGPALEARQQELAAERNALADALASDSLAAPTPTDAPLTADSLRVLRPLQLAVLEAQMRGLVREFARPVADTHRLWLGLSPAGDSVAVVYYGTQTDTSRWTHPTLSRAHAPAARLQFLPPDTLRLWLQKPDGQIIGAYRLRPAP
jgi:hypothetical protein